MAIKDLTPLSYNIRNFILKNGMSRRQFADEVNNVMENYGSEVKIYTEKDILGYETRGSRPDDDRALVAIAKTINKPLEELLTRFYSMEELALPQNKEVTVATKKWSMATFNKLSEAQKELILDIIATGLGQENEKLYAVLDIKLSYHEGKSVAATMCYGSNYEKIRTFEWTWIEYGKKMEELDCQFGDEDEAYIIYSRLESEIFTTLWSIGLIDDFYCFKADTEENFFENNTNGHFFANVWFSITPAEMIKLLKLNVKRAKNEYERLLEREGAKKK